MAGRPFKEDRQENVVRLLESTPADLSGRKTSLEGWEDGSSNHQVIPASPPAVAKFTVHHSDL